MIPRSAGVKLIKLEEAQTIQLAGYGKLSGKYFIDKISLSYSRSGLEMQLVCSKIPNEETAEAGLAGTTIPAWTRSQSAGSAATISFTTASMLRDGTESQI